MKGKRKTLGEQRVRVLFNPNNDDYVYQINEQAAKLIDLINNAAPKNDWDDQTVKEWLRLKALAMTSFEDGAMWGVKAATI